jgi:hypothetical protein
MIRPQGINYGAFGCVDTDSTDTVWYALFFLLLSASAATDTGPKPFDCALVSTLKTHKNSENGNNYINYINYDNYTYNWYCDLLLALFTLEIASFCTIWCLLFPSGIISY